MESICFPFIYLHKLALTNKYNIKLNKRENFSQDILKIYFKGGYQMKKQSNLSILMNYAG